jgi:hypothetical protein
MAGHTTTDYFPPSNSIGEFAAMKSSLLRLTTVSVLTLTLLGVPISSDQPGWGEVAKGLGFCALLSVATLGLVTTSYCIKGAINNHNNHKAIDHYFDELKKFENERSMAKVGARNTTDGVEDYLFKEESIASESSSDESGSTTESDHTAVLARLLKTNKL